MMQAASEFGVMSSARLRIMELDRCIRNQGETQGVFNIHLLLRLL